MQFVVQHFVGPAIATLNLTLAFESSNKGAWNHQIGIAQWSASTRGRLRPIDRAQLVEIQCEDLTAVEGTVLLVACSVRARSISAAQRIHTLIPWTIFVML
jgi:hypothetical protein